MLKILSFPADYTGVPSIQLGSKELEMKRTTISLLLVVGCAFGLNAQSRQGAKSSKLDKKLENQLKKGNPSDTVQVIIQSHDLASLPDKLSGSEAKNVKSFATFPGMAAEIKLNKLAAFAQDNAIDAISSDEPVAGSTIDGTEPVSSSSGAAAALRQFGIAGAGVGVAIIDSGIAKVGDLNNIYYSMDFTNNTVGKHIDGYGHGTHVAGIVAGSGVTSGGAKTYSGVAPGAK